MATGFNPQGPPRLFLDYSDPHYNPIARRNMALNESRSSLSNFLEGINSGTAIGVALIASTAFQQSRIRRSRRR